MNVIVTVVGSDKVGIIAGISPFFALRNINIIDISQTILSGNFVMVMMVDLSHNIMHEKVFSAMHRI
jgi:ACT domain-containing protein